MTAAPSQERRGARTWPPDHAIRSGPIAGIHRARDCYVTPGRRQLWQYVGNVTTGNFALTAAALQRVAKRTDPLDLIAGETKR